MTELKEQVADVRRAVDEANHLVRRIRGMLSKLNEQDHYRHMHLNHEAEVLQAAVQSLLQGVEGWQEGWPPDHATAVGDCPACGCATNIPKESVFECYVCGVRLVRELKVGVVQELTVGERVL